MAERDHPNTAVAADLSTGGLMFASAAMTGLVAGAGLAGWAVYGGKLQLAYLADAILRCF